MEPFLWSKVFDFSGTTIAKTLSFVFKTIVILFIVIGIPGLLIWQAYVTFIKPHTNPTPTQSQVAEKIENIYYYPNKTVFSLINLWGWELLSKHTYPTEAIVKTKIVESKKEVKK